MLIRLVSSFNWMSKNAPTEDDGIAFVIWYASTGKKKSVAAAHNEWKETSWLRG